MSLIEIEFHEMVNVKRECWHCKQTFSFTVNLKDLQAWHRGELAQDCFPYLSAGDRELLISNTCDTCFDEVFPEDDYEQG